MIKFELVTLNGTKFGERVHEVVLPTPDGLIAVFEHHMPLVTLASPGIISIRFKENDPDDLMELYATNGGVIEVSGDTIRMLVDEADASDEINEQEVAKALERAKELKTHAKDSLSVSEAQNLIDHQATRLKLAELKRHRKKHYK